MLPGNQMSEAGLALLQPIGMHSRKIGDSENGMRWIFSGHLISPVGQFAQWGGAIDESETPRCKPCALNGRLMTPNDETISKNLLNCGQGRTSARGAHLDPCEELRKAGNYPRIAHPMPQSPQRISGN